MSAMKPPCSCKLVQCDPCGRMVPIGETLQLGPEESGAAQCDTTACAKCRGGDSPEDVHPTCEDCGSCDACDCEEKAKAAVRAELGAPEPDLFIMAGPTGRDRLNFQRMLDEDFE